MTTKFTHHPNGFLEITGCPNCDEAWYLWFYEGVWRLDDSDGMTGTEVNYCPWCGVRLEPPVVEAYPLLRNLGDFLYWHTMTADEKYIMLIGALVSKPECIENDDGTTTRIFRSAGKEETP